MQTHDWTVDETTLRYLDRISSATVTTQLFKRGLRNRYLKDVSPIKPGQRMVGPARTLRYVPMREDIDTLDTLGARSNAQRALIEDMRPGEVMVIDAMGQTGAGSLGSILARRLQVIGAAGIVTDGAYRDTPGIRELAIPTYARGENGNTNLTLYHPADFDLTIGCGGVMVEKGDCVVGDDEGVVVIPRHLVVEVAQDAFEQEVRERFIDRRVGEGASVFEVYPLSADADAAYRALRARVDPFAYLDGELDGDRVG